MADCNWFANGLTGRLPSEWPRRLIRQTGENDPNLLVTDIAFERFKNWLEPCCPRFVRHFFHTLQVTLFDPGRHVSDMTMANVCFQVTPDRRWCSSQLLGNIVDTHSLFEQWERYELRSRWEQRRAGARSVAATRQ